MTIDDKEKSEGCAEIGGGTHVATATGAFGGAAYAATRRVEGVPKSLWGCMWPLPLGPSVELRMGLRNV
eukprot:1503996-Pyramimonas_sp.AAC.1